MKSREQIRELVIKAIINNDKLTEVVDELFDINSKEEHEEYLRVIGLSDWIPVENVNLKDNEVVVVALEDGTVNSDEFVSSVFLNEYNSGIKVTHYQQFPKHPLR